MKAMILAAGRGERMRPLTDHTPKPLLVAGGKPLIVWHLERLAAAGFREVVINHAHLGEQIEAALGSGAAWGLSLRYSPEPPGALETAGGIARALPLLGQQPFLVVNGDIFTDWDVARARQVEMKHNLAHVVLAPNPPHHPGGDFSLDEGRLRNLGGTTFTYTGLGVFAPELFLGVSPDVPSKLGPLLRAAADHGCATGECHDGLWLDIGTPERLAELDERLSNPC